MAKQRLTVSRKVAVCIETPAGMISIWSAGGKKLEIVLPDGMVANVGEDRAFSSGRWLERKDGRVVAKFKLLTPVLAQDGSLIGLDSPTVKRLAL